MAPKAPTPCTPQMETQRHTSAPKPQTFPPKRTPSQPLLTPQALVDEMENIIEQKGRFMSSVSHELRTPLNGIIGEARGGRGACRPCTRVHAHPHTHTHTCMHCLLGA